MAEARAVWKVQSELGIGMNVAEELTTLADDADMAIEESQRSKGLSMCKANIIDHRFKDIEYRLDKLERKQQ